MNQFQTPGACPSECPPFWVADASYTARCLSPKIGGTLTIKRQARSTISMEDAVRKARILAKKEAIAELKCYFPDTQCVAPYCAGNYYDPICRTVWSPNSQQEANEAAIAAATEAAQEWCETEVDSDPSPIILPPE